MNRQAGIPSAAGRRILAPAGAVLAAAAVALAAYASHAAGPDAGARLGLAAAFAFGHGLALAALAPRAAGRLAMAGLWAMLVGVALFAGSLAGAHFFDLPTRLAPMGGSLMILGWLLHAAASIRD
ncbi:DUF423 domain-containing protein [Luteimonas terricola]|uniref:DUF423 domain-containing protein n=1 Tax=Luteimonas terricola TaxID=645597 RepID=A0ABQ2EHS7_9GAMM|nr:DUF423 domain-containing protein [Luteimonas terricola]GGK09861.1 hypothetical protein GCM10011394_19140 [Luteimonas terricola]